MTTSEKTIEKNIRTYLDSLNAYHIKIHGSAFMAAGTPDILTCVGGHFVGIEVKRKTGGVVSPLQKFKIREIQNAGGIALVARSVEDVKKEFRKEGLIG